MPSAPLPIVPMHVDLSASLNSDDGGETPLGHTSVLARSLGALLGEAGRRIALRPYRIHA